jgi:hypothetical protein
MDFLEEADTAGNFAGDTGTPKGGLASVYIYIYTLYIYIETRFNLSLSLLNIYI